PYLPVGEPVVARALAMLIAYALVSGGIFLAAWMVRETLRKLRFMAFDRHLGMILGGLEGALLGLVGTLFVVSRAPTAPEPIFQSPSGKLVSQRMDIVGPILPREVRDVVEPFWQHAGARMAGSSSNPEDLSDPSVIQEGRSPIVRDTAGSNSTS